MKNKSATQKQKASSKKLSSSAPVSRSNFNFSGGVKIDKPRDYVIVEKSNGNDILKGSKLFCGCCGKSLGELKKKLIFPFTTETLKASVKNKTFSNGIAGRLRHDLCRHTMFFCGKGWNFITLENYIKQTSVGKS